MSVIQLSSTGANATIWSLLMFCVTCPTWCHRNVCDCLKISRIPGSKVRQYHIIRPYSTSARCVYTSCSLDTCHSSWWLGDAVSWSDYCASHRGRACITKTMASPSRGNHFSAITVLLINHHKLHPWLQDLLMSMWNACYGDASWVFPGPLSLNHGPIPPWSAALSVTLICWLSKSGKTQTERAAFM